VSQRNLYSTAVEPAAPTIGKPTAFRGEYLRLFERLSARIIALCAERGITPEELGQRAWVGYWAAHGGWGGASFGHGFPLSALYRIAKALVVPVGKL